MPWVVGTISLLHIIKWVDHFITQWFFLLLLSLSLLTIWVRRLVGTLAAVAWLYFNFSSLFIYGLFRQNRYIIEHVSVRNKVAYDTAYSHISMLIYSFLFLLMPMEEMSIAIGVIGWLGILDGIYVIGQAIFIPGSHLNWGGFLEYTGMNACFMAISIPLFLYELKRTKYPPTLEVLLFFPIVAIILSKATMPYVALAAMGVSHICYRHYISPHKRTKKAAFCAVFGLLFVLILAGYLSIGTAFFSDSLRFKGYEIFMTYWYHKANWFIGFGNGSFRLLGPVIQGVNEFMLHNWWIWMHSDWLQLLFETGLIGFVLGCCIFITTVRRALVLREPLLLHAVVGYSAVAAFNYPARYGLTAACGMLLLCYLLRKDRPYKSHHRTWIR